MATSILFSEGVMDTAVLAANRFPDPLWIVGKVIPPDDEGYGGNWEFQGVFSREETAVAACKEYNWFVAPAWVDVEIEAFEGPWPGLYYPLRERQ